MITISPASLNSIPLSLESSTLVTVWEAVIEEQKINMLKKTLPIFINLSFSNKPIFYSYNVLLFFFWWRSFHHASLFRNNGLAHGEVFWSAAEENLGGAKRTRHVPVGGCKFKPTIV